MPTADVGLREFREIESAVLRALEKLYAKDIALFTCQTSEWAIAHRLAVYLEQEMPEWNVDCEYNRQGSTNMPKPNADGTKVRPDIIVHHRTRLEREHNLLVIEMKVGESSEELKVSNYTRTPSGEQKYQYQWGLLLSDLKTTPDLRWYQGGNLHQKT